MGKEEEIKRLKRVIKDYGYVVTHLAGASPKKLEEYIGLLKKQFYFEDVIFILRGKTTRRRMTR